LALNTEYFSEIMHLLRQPAETMIYRHVVEHLVNYPSEADTRDTEAVLRLCTGYVKLFFPHITDPAKMDMGEFKRYCLRPAVTMRTIIRRQLQAIDPDEYGNKNMAAYTVREASP
jgi:ATP-dependent Lon protease